MVAGRTRLEGYRDGLAAAGLASSTTASWSTATSARRAARPAMRDAARRGAPTSTAVFCANDLMAAGALRVLREAGRQVPDDVSVVGFDDAPLAPVDAPAADHGAPVARADGPRRWSSLLLRRDGAPRRAAAAADPADPPGGPRQQLTAPARGCPARAVCLGCPRALRPARHLARTGRPASPARRSSTRVLADRGIDARWVRWDDPDVDWAAADLVAVRSTWDYVAPARRVPAPGPGEVEAATRLLNGADVFAWNVDKAYLAGLQRPRAGPAGRPDRAGRRPRRDRRRRTPVRQRRGQAAGRRQRGRRASWPTDPTTSRLETACTAGPWVVQPLVESVRTEGETSVFVLDGRAGLAGRQAAGGRRDPGARGVRRQLAAGPAARGGGRAGAGGGMAAAERVLGVRSTTGGST